MSNSSQFIDRFKLEFVPTGNRRVIADKDVVLHCHHYNARLQNAIESVSQIEGKHIISSSAEAVFAEHISNAFQEGDTDEQKWQIAIQLYAFLGYGKLDLSDKQQGMIYGLSSHYAEGWAICFSEADRPICSFTEGYIQAMFYAISGEIVYAREVQCLHQGAPQCRFEIDFGRQQPFTQNRKLKNNFAPDKRQDELISITVNAGQIIDALVELPVEGNDQGLIPLFNVYLASTPADFYNLVCIRFLEEMAAINRSSSGQRLLLFCAEICGLTTFRGIMQSPEWAGLVAPMIATETDRLLAIYAISNGLGWGDWYVLDHQPGHSLKVRSLIGYEASGYRHYRQQATNPQCFMFTGVAAGIMELLYGEGTVEERYGTFASEEQLCICCGDNTCQFEVFAL